MNQPALNEAPGPESKRAGKTVEDVFQDIKKMIYYNLLAPGQKIIYKDLARRLNVSVTPVVQALKQLERSNLVSYERNKGYFVEELTEETVEDLYQAREALEIYSVPLILKNLTKDDLRSIRKAFKHYSDATAPDQGRWLMLKDAQFHLKIVEYSGNKIIYAYLLDILEQIYLRYKPEHLLKDRVKEALKEHRAIFNALEKGDAARVQSLIRDHIQKGKGHIIHNLRSSRELLFPDKA